MSADVLLEFIKSKYQIIGVIIYIVYNEYKRKMFISENNIQERDMLLINKANDEANSRCDRRIKAFFEMERYVFNTLKMYKNSVLNECEFPEDVTRLCADGVLLTSLTKVQRSIMTHISDNGYHDLTKSELEDYINYVTNEVSDIITNTIDKNKQMLFILDYVHQHDINDMVRKMIDTSIEISNRIK